MITQTLWLDKLPSAWPAGRIKDHVTLVNGFPFDSQCFSTSIGVRLVRIRDLTDGGEPTYVDTEVPDTAMIDSGDIVVGMDGDFNAVVWTGGPAALNQRLCVLRAHPSLDQRFLGYVLAMPLKALNDVTYFTTVKHLSSSDLLGERIPLPSLARQRDIVNYLDHETARIDALITAKQRMVELIHLRWSSARLYAVTGGLATTNKRHNLQPWLAGVPVHWTPTKLSYIADICSGGTPNTEKDDYWGGDIPWVSPKDVKRFDLSSTDDCVTRRAVDDARLPIIEPGAVLFVVRGMILAHTFPVALNAMRTTINQDMKAAIPRAGVEPRFLAHLLAGLAGPILALLVEESAHGTRALRMERWKEFSLYLPPRQEQLDIVRNLDRLARAVRSAVDSLTSQIDLLQERRQALITAAVTGQLEIPEAA